MISDFGFRISDFWKAVPDVRTTALFCLFTFAFLLGGCSIPNLENPDCSAARNRVKHFYSFHFGNDMRPSAENLKLRAEYLTPELKAKLEKQEGPVDYFTATDDYPKAFRAGKCEVIEPGKRVRFQILLFWKTETRSEEREISVDAVKQNDGWLIDQVESKN
ncbi:MAG: DUF3828 domain-containing protein [Pyrinomonadaceae bacterium]